MTCKSGRLLPTCTMPRIAPRGSIYARRTAGWVRRTVYENGNDEAERLGLAPPQFLTVNADDGTRITRRAVPTKARRRTEAATYCIRLRGETTRAAGEQHLGNDRRSAGSILNRSGYAVLKLDNRGSARRGLAFESAILGDMGNLEVSDQVAGVKAVSSPRDQDRRFTGWNLGWSYGGYMTAICMLKEPSCFWQESQVRQLPTGTVTTPITRSVI